MDDKLAIAAALAAEQLPSGQDLKAQLACAGGLAAWLAQRNASGSLLTFSPGVRAIGWDEAEYPAGCRRLAHPPPALFVTGLPEPLPQGRECVAIVGSRRCTEGGRFVARDLAAGLARRGIVVVSGLALGIDAAAHEGALDAGGRTLAVLAGPVDRPGPARNLGLARQIEGGSGWLVSERPPAAAVRPQDFPRRNRLIAALSSLVVVVEADVTSGTMSTVQWALSLGVEVAAVPGPVTSPASAGCNALLASGAQVVSRAEDVLALAGRAREPWRDPPELDDDERAVLAGLPGASGSVGTWVRASGLAAERARQALARLVVRGVLRKLPGGRLGRVL